MCATPGRAKYETVSRLDGRLELDPDLGEERRRPRAGGDHRQLAPRSSPADVSSRTPPAADVEPDARGSSYSTSIPRAKASRARAARTRCRRAVSSTTSPSSSIPKLSPASPSPSTSYSAAQASSAPRSGVDVLARVEEARQREQLHAAIPLRARATAAAPPARARPTPARRRRSGRSATGRGSSRAVPHSRTARGRARRAPRAGAPTLTPGRSRLLRRRPPPPACSWA